MAERRFDIGLDPENKDAQRQMWDSWWYDRFEIPHTIPDGARGLQMEMGGETFGAVLLDHVAPKTCQAFWEALPYTGNMIHCAWFGHAAFYLDRVPLLDALGYELENRFQRLAPGDIVWDPYIEEVTIAYGRNAFVNFPTTIYTKDGRAHPNQVCIFGRVVENLDGFAVMCKRLRYEGTKPMTTRRAAQRPHAAGRVATGLIIRQPVAGRGEPCHADPRPTALTNTHENGRTRPVGRRARRQPRRRST